MIILYHLYLIHLLCILFGDVCSADLYIFRDVALYFKLVDIGLDYWLYIGVYLLFCSSELLLFGENFKEVLSVWSYTVNPTEPVWKGLRYLMLYGSFSIF